jgi:hypothetical protein
MGRGSAIRGRAGGTAAFLAVLVAALMAAPSAQAQFGVDPDDWIAQVFGTNTEVFDVATQTYGQNGIFDQAGGHPWKGITDFSMRLDGSGNPQGGNPTRVRVDVPVGLVPNPTLFPRCPRALFDAGTCPPDTQIGIEEIDIKEGPAVARVQVPLYNLEIEPDQVSVFALSAADAAPLVPAIGGLAGIAPTFIVGGVRDQPSGFGPHDTGLFFTIDDVPASPAIRRSKLTFWGVPGDPVHNAQRDQACATVLEPIAAPPVCAGGGIAHTNPDLPFLNNPTHCTGTSQITRLSLWSQPSPPPTAAPATTVTTSTPVIDGKRGAQRCDLVPFGAGIEVTPDTTQPDAPVGPLVRLATPQEGLEDKDVLVTSHVKDVTVTMPPGMTINPSAANGLAACTDAQLAANAGVVGGDTCPEAAKIGTVDVKSPLLPDSVNGFAFVGQPLSGDMYRLFVTLEGRGVSVRLKGSVKPNPATGQLTAIFKSNPEQPFDTFDVDFENGSRAPLATPLDCGSKTATSTLTPWSGNAAVSPSDSFTIGGPGCPAGFQPTFGSRAATSAAGAFSPFTATIARPDRNQILSRVTVATPPGLGGMISRVEECSSALAATGACPASSRIGTATTRSGAGPEPFRIAGPVYLTEGYKGAPFGMVVAIRAIAGPYDLGTVVVRQSVFVDPNDAHVTVVSDPLPTILKGVPIRLRDVVVALDKPGFVYNPTSCGVKPVGATLYPLQGSAVKRGATIRTDSCQALRFAPKMAMQLTGVRQMGFGKHPGLRVRVTQDGRQANIGKARVVLPLALALDPDNAQAICSFEGGQRADCPAASRIGFATARSPALDEPVKGPVYFVQGIRIDPNTGARIRTLPSLLAKLNGEVRVNLRGATDVLDNRLVSTFDKVPDAPVSRFDMRLKGGKGGILAVSARRGICGRKRQVSSATFTGHNAALLGARVNMVKPCARPKLRIRRTAVRGNRLVVRGTIARAAAKRKVKVTLRCGGARVAKRARRAGARRWVAALRLRGGCAAARRGRLRVSYPGGGPFRNAVRRRPVSL